MKKFTITVLACLQTAFLFAQKPYTPEVLWQFGRLGESQLSPDKKQVLYTVTYTDLQENKNNADLYVQPVADGQPRRLTQTPGSEHNPTWRPDGKKVAYLSAESGSPQLYEMNPDGTGKKQVTQVEGGIANFKYAPNQQYVLFTREVKVGKEVKDLYPDLPKANARIIDDLMYRHWDEWDDHHVNHVFYAGYQDGTFTSAPKDIMEGEPFDAPLQPFGGAEQLAFSPDGTLIAYTSKKLSGKGYALSTDSDLYLYDIRTVQTQNLTQGMPGYDSEPTFSPDGTKLAWISMETAGYEADKNRIFVYDFKTKTKEDLTSSTEQSAGGLEWAPNGRRIYFVSSLKGTEQIFEADVRAKKVRQLTSGVHNYNSIQLAGDQFIASKTSMSKPAEWCG